MRAGRWCVSGILLATAAGCASRGASVPAREPLAPVTAGRLFEFHSGFWLNLHHFLYVQARARAGHDAERSAVMASLGDTAGSGARSMEERLNWASALDYYERQWAKRDVVFDSAATAVKSRLASLDDARVPTLINRALDPDLAAALERAAPLYRALWWPRHDAANRAWVAAMQPLLRQHGETIARGVTRAMLVPWPATPIRVDASPYTNWAGAYTTEHPPHIMISSIAEGYRGSLGLEMLFHEAMHTMEDSVAAARVRARGETGKRIPYDVVHAIIFYTAGEVTRRAVPGHTPYIEAEGLKNRGSLSRYFPLLERHWRPYLDGTASFNDSFAAMVAEL
jgi:hypothetical protein